MTRFRAGRFAAYVQLGVQAGRTTQIIEMHRNGSSEEIGMLQVDYDDLPDLLHVLQRAIKAHEQ